MADLLFEELIEAGKDLEDEGLWLPKINTEQARFIRHRVHERGSENLGEEGRRYFTNKERGGVGLML